MTSMENKAPVQESVVAEKVFFKGVDGREEGHEYCPYNETSKDYDETRAPLGLNIFLGSMCLMDTPVNKQKLLDVGCGTGTFLERIRPHVGEAMGIEYNDGMIKQAQSRLGENVRLVQGSADKLPFEDGSFDVCTINQVIHHFPKDDGYAFNGRAFKELYRVLKPGGVFVLNTTMPEQQRDAFWWLALFPTASQAICARFPPLAVLLEQLRTAGFEINADSIAVPLHRTLMAEQKYLEHGVKGAFMPSYRAGDSSWSMAENFGELEAGLQTLQKMIDDGTVDVWLSEREALRKSTGQATFITAYKR